MERAEQRVTCPYCGEPLTLLLDDSDLGQDYIEDCQVCCQPIRISYQSSAEGELLSLSAEQDT